MAGPVDCLDGYIYVASFLPCMGELEFRLTTKKNELVMSLVHSLYYILLSFVLDPLPLEATLFDFSLHGSYPGTFL